MTNLVLSTEVLKHLAEFSTRFDQLLDAELCLVVNYWVVA